MRALAADCRRDIALLTPSLLAAAEISLSLLSSDLEVSAKVASMVRETQFIHGLIRTDCNISVYYMDDIHGRTAHRRRQCCHQGLHVHIETIYRTQYSQPEVARRGGQK